MKINTAVKNNFLIFRIYGELDMNTVPEFKKKIENLLHKKKKNNILLNLKKMDFIDSTGIGAILGIYKTINKLNGKLIIVGVNTRVKNIFEISGIYSLINFYKNEENALSQIKGGK